MPDRRSHRGAAPGDGELFGPGQVAALRAAVGDLGWLLTRGYGPTGALKLVGDRYRLTARQRQAVQRSCCTDGARDGRAARRVAVEALAGERVELDGYNVLTTLETALGGGMVFVGRDGAWRDIASVHGTYRRTEETLPALEAVGAVLGRAGVGAAHWYLDAPVSNSGRLRGMIEGFARERGWPWTVEVVPNPDAVLVGSRQVVATADSVILDGPVRWVELVGAAVEGRGVWVVDLGDP